VGDVLTRGNACLAAVTAVALLSGACVPRIDSHAPAEPLALTYDASGGGWAHLSQPGWFSCDVPGRPSSAMTDDRAPAGVFSFKKIVLQTQTARFGINLVEFANPADVSDARSGVLEQYAKKDAASGLRVTARNAIDVDGFHGDEIATEAAPGSSTNGAPYPVVSRLRVLVQGNRFYIVQCTSPAEHVADCERFFVSFHLETDRTPSGR
jgi:hypothetical protein